VSIIGLLARGEPGRGGGKTFKATDGRASYSCGTVMMICVSAAVFRMFL
jgi:hypothetical protein